MNNRPYRDQREEDVLQRLAAEYIQMESNRTSLVTVTSVIIGDRGRNARILFTVLPEEKEAGVLDFLKRKRPEFREYIKNKAKLSVIPFIEFEIDFGERNRQTVDRLI